MKKKSKKNEEEKKLIIDTLLKAYDHRFTEIMFYADKYHKKSIYLQAYFTIIIALFSFLFSEKSSEILKHLNTSHKNFGLILILSLLLSTLFFLFNSLSESLYLLHINSLRNAAIEKEINKRFQVDIIIWDSKIAPDFLNKTLNKKVRWINPNVWMGLWGYISYGIISILLCTMSFINLYEGNWIIFSFIYSGIAGFFLFYNIYQFKKLSTDKIQKFIKEEIVKDKDICWGNLIYSWGYYNYSQDSSNNSQKKLNNSWEYCFFLWKYRNFAEKTCYFLINHDIFLLKYCNFIKKNWEIFKMANNFPTKGADFITWFASFVSKRIIKGNEASGASNIAVVNMGGVPLPVI